MHYAWLIRGKNQAVQDFIEISAPLTGGNLSVNIEGYPADTRETSLTLSGVNDCLDVWRAVLDSTGVVVADDDSSDFTATSPPGGVSCTYTYNRQPSLTVDYDSNSGQLTINR